jgi:hypothetical protein
MFVMNAKNDSFVPLKNEACLQFASLKRPPTGLPPFPLPTF